MSTGVAPSQPSQDLDLIDDLTENLAFIRGVIAGPTIAASTAASFAARCDAVEARARDPRLYLAVIGEFSSGKSTLINALVRRELLRSSIQVTTAAVTRIQRGAEFTIDVVFRDGSTASATELAADRLRARLRPLCPALSGTASLPDLIDLLTSDAGVAAQVTHVTLTLPDAGLPDELVILDTPGISAAQHDAADHQGITEHALTELADAVLVIAPAFAPMSRALIGFLDATAQPFLHRCIFVVTAMDQVEPEDQTRLLGYVAAELRRHFELEAPVVVDACALAMLPAPPAALDPLAAVRAHWQARFAQMEDLVKTTMLRKRRHILAERTVRLLRDLLQSLSDNLADKQREIEAETQLLQASSIAAIEEVLGRLVTDCERKIQDRTRWILTRAATLRSVFCANVKRIAHGLIASRPTAKYAEVIEPSLREVARRQGQAYVDAVNRELNGLRALCGESSLEFARQFEAQYRVFPSLNTRVAVPAITVAALPALALDFGASRRYLAEQRDKDRKGAAAGAAAGVALGLVAAAAGPVVIVGAAVGAMIGSRKAGDSAEQRQQQVLLRSSEEIESYFTIYQADIEARIHTTARQCLTQFEAVARRHKIEYGDRVGALIRQHEDTERRLRDAAIAIGRDIAEVTHRVNRLGSLAHRLQRL
jgi:predicted GTPase